jgi:hypothetical protein
MNNEHPRAVRPPELNLSCVAAGPFFPPSIDPIEQSLELPPEN